MLRDLVSKKKKKKKKEEEQKMDGTNAGFVWPVKFVIKSKDTGPLFIHLPFCFLAHFKAGPGSSCCNPQAMFWLLCPASF
jgi:hypothetical protein